MTAVRRYKHTIFSSATFPEQIEVTRDESVVSMIIFVKGHWSANPRKYIPAAWMCSDGTTHGTARAAHEHEEAIFQQRANLLVTGLGF